VSVSSCVESWTGLACRHIPDDSPFGVLDTRFAGRTLGNRWNRGDEPTFYLASDHAVLVAEFARHLRADAGLTGRATEARRVYDLRLEFERVLDVRDERVCRFLDLRDAPVCFLDREVARATAAFLRRVVNVQAIFVPSVAFLDDPSRWVLVVFLENLSGSLESIVRSVERNGLLQVAP
jgi:RES domain-containing protein